MDDDSLMPFGKYKDTKLANVPASYLLWLHEKGTWHTGLNEYLKENLEALKLEVKNENREKYRNWT